MLAARLIACFGAFALGCGVPALQAAPNPPPETASANRPGRSPALGTTEVSSGERNFWPIYTWHAGPDLGTREWTSVGPLLFSRSAADGAKAEGLRPLWVQHVDAEGHFRAGYFLYPVFSYRVDENTYQWNVLELIRNTGRRRGAGPPSSIYSPRGDFEFWPFIFWRQTGDPALSYFGVFPVAGTIKNKLGFDQATWVAFPLYVRTANRGIDTTYAPWPFLRVTSGKAHGFGLWPLFNWREKPGAWKQTYFLWPLGYDATTSPAPDAPAGTPPRHAIGFLPFYARHTGPGYVDENVLWPFFGYTDRTTPARFHETRYFWPFLVQGRGSAYVNRWGPFYTHSIVNGYDKTWYGWPLVRHAEWKDRGLAIERTQLFYFLYWSETQRSATRPAAPEASLTHVWPLYSTWTNGAGRSQFQLFSPLDVFFPGNQKIHDAWSPLFAILRRDQAAPGETRTSLLWNAVTWQRDDARRLRAFHLGPLLSVTRRAAAERISIGHGVVAFTRDATGGWTTRWFDFAPGEKAAGASAHDRGHGPANFPASNPNPPRGDRAGAP
ncbi:MAG TPA: hypothetical protein VHE61_04015 [Opitutaceae bacterium]|nr:hypothetical protein [Opitutaceae bacterium]